jgi:hypothetical protein
MLFGDAKTFVGSIAHLDILVFCLTNSL